jgi:hypothetical protein
MLWMRGGMLVTLVMQGLTVTPGAWGAMGSPGYMVSGGFTRGLAAAVLMLLRAALVVARQRDSS